MAIALVNDPTLVPLMGPLAIDAYINPRATTVSSILRHIRHGRVRGVYSIGDAEAEVIEAQVLSTSPLAGQAVRDIDFPEGALLGAVQKAGKVIRPTGATRIEEGDAIVIFALAADVPEVERSCRSPSTSSERCWPGSERFRFLSSCSGYRPARCFCPRPWGS
jgi:trk system potassium uptake protein TrkA